MIAPIRWPAEQQPPTALPPALRGVPDRRDPRPADAGPPAMTADQPAAAVPAWQAWLLVGWAAAMTGLYAAWMVRFCW